eukprot:gb/GEZJ01007774.1/.p1 GENE.gb/GEZJ01007774.1/~~gb/GEZJ01007774.1/.p1  ORF type:complete len:194 (-),score=12.60 gb/GEZJ01007774.1/:69-650(-)
MCQSGGMCVTNSRTGVSFCMSSLIRNNSTEIDPSQSEEPTQISSNSSILASPILASPTALFPDEAGPVASPDAEEESQVQSANACIASKLLLELDPNELLYKRHYPAEVFCDRHESCATAGHMILYQGWSMMMSSYCLKVGCSRRMTYVNSPKYKRSLRIRSNTPGLTFLAFAARYGSHIEEKVLAVAIRMGL